MLLEKFGPAKKFSGFTLVEIALVVGILVLLGAASFVYFTRSRNVRLLLTTGQEIISVLRAAQAQSLAGQDNSPWGVHFEQNRFVLFRGASYPASTSTQVFILPDVLEIMGINLAGGGQDVLFNWFDGATAQSGSLNLRVINSPTDIFSVTIDPSGKVYETISVPTPSGTRITDTRHRNFNLGWSIQNSQTLTLTFSDPNSVYSVNMPPYFANATTTFDWADVLTVGGQEQTMRIHTVFLDSGNTILSVDRDCRQNGKQVKISIDSKDIATYAADCQTVTVGPFGGTVMEP